MNFAVIGTNFITDRFIAAGNLCEDFNVRAVYSRKMETAKAFADKYAIPDCYDSLEDLAEAENVDAVYIASPTSCHAAQTIQMLTAGKHVLCEKPVASNERELLAMLEAARDNGVILLEAMRSVFDPGFAAVEAALPKIGKVRRIIFQNSHYSSRYDNFKNGIIENAFKPELSNGSVMDMGCYCVHPLMRLCGKPDQIFGTCVKLHNGVDGAATILAKYEKEGILAELSISKITNTGTDSQIQGEEGCILIDDIMEMRKVKIVFRDGTVEEIPVEKADVKNNMNYEIQTFMHLVENGESADTYNLHSVWEMQVMDEARRQMGIVLPADQM